MSKTKLVIGVTGLQAGAYPAPGIEVARSLAAAQFDRSVSFVGIDYDPLCSGLFLKSLFSSTHVITSSSSHSLVEKLAHISGSTGLTILIPCLDYDVSIFSSIVDQLKERGIETLLPYPDSLRWARKESLETLLNGIQLYTPEMEVVHSEIQLAQMSRQCPLPAVVKGSTCGAFPARTRDAVQVYAERAVRLFGWPIIIQRFVSGAEYSIVGVADAHSRLRGCAALKKFGVSDDGQTWSAVTVRPDNFISPLQELTHNARWMGPLEIDVIVEEDSERTYLLDFNPRFPSWIFVATEAGANLPKLLVDLMCGRPPEEMLSAKSGTVCSLHLDDIVIQGIEEFVKLQIDSEGEIGDVYRKV